MKIEDNFSLRTVRKKIIMVSKIAGIILIISYVISTRLPIEQDFSFLLWLCFVILLVLAVDYLMGRFISKPVDRLSEAARKMAQLDFSSSCEIHTNDEFGELSQNLNKMAQNLQQTLSQLQTANCQLEKDVEREKRLLEERKELVDSLSHEMKTPLAVIMGTAETILGDVQMDESTRRRFLEKLYRSAARLNRFIDQTLELYRLESTGVSVEEPTAIETVIAQSVLNPSDKIVRYDNRTTRAFLIDAFHTEMILSNLINNAVKYSTAKEIDVKIEEQDGALILEVADGGPLIPEKDRKRIFERFYTVSKSRQKSGFGLGLSIVKHIAGLYDGEATVFENERGGNTFRIVLHEKKKREIT